MLTPTKKAKLQNEVKAYVKKYLNGKIVELDESGTRLMINDFLTNALGFTPIEDVRTEYMIKGTYADYVIQLKGKRQFLVEVKALSLQLSDKHLRQAVNYGANEGIEWALLTNGRQFELYKIIFDQPIDSRLVFSVDLEDAIQVKGASDYLQFLHKDSVANHGLTFLWNKNCALEPNYIAGLLYAPEITNFIKKTLKAKFNSKFEEEDIHDSISQIVEGVCSPDQVKPMTKSKLKGPVKKSSNNIKAMDPPSITGSQTENK